MKVFVVNAGSSSIKCQLLDGTRLYESDHGLLWHGQVNFHDGKETEITSSPVGKGDRHFTAAAADAEGGYRKLFDEITNSCDHLASVDEIKAVGHRVVHGGEKYNQPTIVDDAVLEDLKQMIKLAPTHEEANIRGVQIARSIFTAAKQVAVFDTGFHHTMPLSAQVFAGPYCWFEEDKIRRFGFHGISHEYCSHQAAELLNADLHSLNIITCHIGNGASLCAIKGGASIMTTMGYTPLDGLVMGNRSGSIDPGLVINLIDSGKYSAKDLSRVLNNESGLKGISGLSNDMRKVLEASQSGSTRAVLAVEIYVNSVAANIAALVPRLGKLDVLVFAGGIGENSAEVREAVCAQLGFLGCTIDENRNKEASEKIKTGAHQDISTASAPVRTLVVKTNEELAIARECLQFLN